MNTKKIIAYAILVAAYLVPFKFAYLDLPDTGPKSLISFLFVVFGSIIFTAILFNIESKEERGE